MRSRVLRGLTFGMAGVVKFFRFMTFAGAETDQGSGRKESCGAPFVGSHGGDTTRRAGNGARGNAAPRYFVSVPSGIRK